MLVPVLAQLLVQAHTLEVNDGALPCSLRLDYIAQEALTNVQRHAQAQTC
jgi:nitrate/nitrite-specific signal transduction histidine kinase